MGKKGGSRHLKRNPAPRFWPIHRKEFVWTVKPKPGPHPIEGSIPLTLILRDILGFAKTRKEAKKIIAQGKLIVNGKIRREEAFPVGIMDVITIPDAKVAYRILPRRKGLFLHPIENKEAAFKLNRIEDKTVVKRGHVQLNFHDGTCKLVQISDPKSPSEDEYKTLDVVKVSIPDGEMMGQIKLAKATTALITGGKNRGVYGKIVDIEEVPGKKRRSLLTTIEDNTGARYKTILDFIFAIGDEGPSISMPEVK